MSYAQFTEIIENLFSKANNDASNLLMKSIQKPETKNVEAKFNDEAQISKRKFKPNLVSSKPRNETRAFISSSSLNYQSSTPPSCCRSSPHSPPEDPVLHSCNNLQDQETSSADEKVNTQPPLSPNLSSISVLTNEESAPYKLSDLNSLSFGLNKMTSKLSSSNEYSRPSGRGSFDECEIEDNSKEQISSDSDQSTTDSAKGAFAGFSSSDLNCVCDLCSKAFFSLDSQDRLCYRCKLANNHHYLQRHRCVRSLCRICRKVEEHKRMTLVLKHQSELQRKREFSQKSMFEDARIKMLEDLKNTCVSETISELKFGDLFTPEESFLAETRTKRYMETIYT